LSTGTIRTLLVPVPAWTLPFRDVTDATDATDAKETNCDRHTKLQPPRQNLRKIGYKRFLVEVHLVGLATKENLVGIWNPIL
jgi:hypothetical protein